MDDQEPSEQEQAADSGMGEDMEDMEESAAEDDIFKNNHDLIGV